MSFSMIAVVRGRNESPSPVAATDSFGVSALYLSHADAALPWIDLRGIGLPKSSPHAAIAWRYTRSPAALLILAQITLLSIPNRSERSDNALVVNAADA